MFNTVKEASDALIHVAYDLKDNPGKHMPLLDWLKRAIYHYSENKDTIRLEGTVIVDRKPVTLSCCINKDEDPKVQVLRQNTKKR